MDTTYSPEQETSIKNIVKTYLTYMITQHRNTIPEYTNALASALTIYTMDQEMPIPKTLYDWIIQTYTTTAKQHQWPKPSIEETIYRF